MKVGFIKWIVVFLAIYGIYSLVPSLKETRYRIYLADPTNQELILEIQTWWGLKKSYHPIVNYEDRWKYKSIDKVEKNESGLRIITYGELKSMPEVKGIFDPEYIDNIYDYPEQ